MARVNPLLVATMLLFWSWTARAGSADVSLEKEVERYLDRTAADAAGPTPLEVLWKTGLRLKGEGIEIKGGGRLMFDMVWIGGEDDVFNDGDAAEGAFSDGDGFFFRRVRFYWSGTVHENTVFRIQIDFSSASNSLQDVHVGLKNLGFVKKLLFGHIRQPFGIEDLTSSKYITFIERSATTNAFALGHDGGVQASGDGWDKRLTWAAGLFHATGSDGSGFGDGDFMFTGRVTAVLWRSGADPKLLHGGFGVHYRGAGVFRARARPIHGRGPRAIDTGAIDTDSATVVHFEVAFVWNSLSIQAEAYLAAVDASAGAADADFTGFYIAVSYFLTGEHRPYWNGVFGRVEVLSPFHGEEAGGTGAWQLVLRFDSVDLADGGIAGGEMDTFTVGVNWHWSSNARVMLNVLFADIEGNDSDGDLTGLILRFQWDF